MNVKVARNKSELKQGGLTLTDMSLKLKEKEQLSNVFNNAMNVFSSIVKKIKPEQQKELFDDGENYKFYNCEIISPDYFNVLKYDVKAIIIHLTGSLEVNKKTEIIKNIDLKDNIISLQQIFSDSEHNVNMHDYLVRMDAIQILDHQMKFSVYNNIKNSIDRLLKDNSLSKDSTIFEFIVRRLKEIVEKNGNYTDTESMKKIIKKILKPSGKYYKQAILPLEDLVHKFSVEILNDFDSSFIENDKEEVTRLQNLYNTAVEEIRRNGDEKAIEILERQLLKLEKAEDITNSSEGFVFIYKDKVYKITGNFAPLNQINGIIKYNPNIPNISKSDSDEKQVLNERLIEKIADITVIPGSFKPPHRGHLEMIKRYALISDKVIVFISPLSRKAADGSDIGFDTSKWMFNLYLKGQSWAKNVYILESPVNSPVGSVLQFVANQENREEYAQPGDTIILGVSSKDEDRFNDSVKKYARSGVKILFGSDYIVNIEGSSLFSEIQTGLPLSSTRMRDAIVNNELEVFSDYLPGFLRGKANQILHTIKKYNKIQVKKGE
jgi:hypothetical protein